MLHEKADFYRHMYIFIRINCSFRDKKLKKQSKKDTQRVKEHNLSNAY